MLKIKDNVDLKELGKKYDFKREYFRDKRYYYANDKYNSIYYIWEDTRIIEINSKDEDKELDNLLYDLIKADLVEKVDE